MQIGVQFGPLFEGNKENSISLVFERSSYFHFLRLCVCVLATYSPEFLAFDANVQHVGNSYDYLEIKCLFFSTFLFLTKKFKT